MSRPVTDPAVRAAYDAMPAAARAKLLALRVLIFDEAAAIGPHGALLETLKWGEPAYLPIKPRVGTTLRLNALKSGGGYALYFPCTTTLAQTYREFHGRPPWRWRSRSYHKEDSMTAYRIESSKMSL